MLFGLACLRGRQVVSTGHFNTHRTPRKMNCGYIAHRHSRNEWHKVWPIVSKTSDFAVHTFQSAALRKHSMSLDSSVAMSPKWEGNLNIPTASLSDVSGLHTQNTQNSQTVACNTQQRAGSPFKPWSRRSARTGQPCGSAMDLQRVSLQARHACLGCFPAERELVPRVATSPTSAYHHSCQIKAPGDDATGRVSQQATSKDFSWQNLFSVHVPRVRVYYREGAIIFYFTSRWSTHKIFFQK